MGREFLFRLIGISIIPFIASGLLFGVARTNSNTGSSVTLTCDPVEDYVNCAYRQVGFDGKLIAELPIPRATYILNLKPLAETIADYLKVSLKIVSLKE